MRIVHHLSMLASKTEIQRLRAQGVDVLLEREREAKIGGFPISFSVEHDDAAWGNIQAIVAKAIDLPATSFTKAEMEAATHFELASLLYSGYPQPEHDFKYKELCYDLREHCWMCGVGRAQTAPFRMRAEPKWGTRHFTRMNWLLDAIFVRADVWRTVFKPFGIGRRAVMHHSSGRELKTVAQLDITELADSPLVVAPDQPKEECGDILHDTPLPLISEADRAQREIGWSGCLSPQFRKYLYINCGYYPGLAAATDRHAFLTQEYFGSGHAADHGIIVSAAVRNAILKHKLKGMRFRPLAPIQ